MIGAVIVKKISKTKCFTMSGHKDFYEIIFKSNCWNLSVRPFMVMFVSSFRENLKNVIKLLIALMLFLIFFSFKLFPESLDTNTRTVEHYISVKSGAYFYDTMRTWGEFGVSNRFSYGLKIPITKKLMSFRCEILYNRSSIDNLSNSYTIEEPWPTEATDCYWDSSSLLNSGVATFFYFDMNIHKVSLFYGFGGGVQSVSHNGYYYRIDPNTQDKEFLGEWKNYTCYSPCLGFCFGISYEIMEKVTLGLEYNFSFHEITTPAININDILYYGNAFPNNSEFSINLRYKLF